MVNLGIPISGETDAPFQLSAILEQRILSGEYAQGKRLPCVRELASLFRTSQLTVVKALNHLEPKGLIIRRPRRGVYVSQFPVEGTSPLRIAFGFPPEKFRPEIIGIEQWQLVSEFYRGLVEGASRNNAEVSFLQFPYEYDDAELVRIRQRLFAYDLVIFTSGELSELANLIGEEQRVLVLDCMGSFYSGDRNQKIVHDRQMTVRLLVEHIVHHGYRSVGAFAIARDVLNGKDRAQNFLNLARSSGLDVSSEFYILLPSAVEQWKDLFSEVLSRSSLPDVFFCDDARFVPELYRLAAETGRYRPGIDFRLLSICSGITLQNLTPPCDYVRIPRYEMGYGTMNIACAAIREHRQFTLPLFPPQLVCGGAF